MSGSTHRGGQTLDLILSLGLPITNAVVDDVCLSDHLLGTTIQSLFNNSLISGNVPDCLKHAVVQPLLKRL